jgi:hypothetical protein
MLARSSIIKHPQGFNIKTPLLIPSFSSKGFKLYKQKKHEAKNFFQTKIELSRKKNPTHGQLSEVAEIFKATSETLTEAMLVSAYDIFHQHIPLPYSNVLPEIIFLDSGGYEAGDIYDDSEVISATGVANEWGTKQYIEVLNAWPKHVPAVFVSNDYICRGMTVTEQIKSAEKLFSHYGRKQLYSILIKPVGLEEFTFKNTLRQIKKNIKKFNQFDIFAVAESDLGNSILSRMENIATIRISLDTAKVHVPIHIFGSLDPLSSCLYFLAGAEIFDGLTWLRYGYFEGKAIYYRNHGIITLGVHEKNDLVRARNINDNIYYLRNLQEQMKAYLLDRDFKKFKYNVEILEEALGKLRARFEGRNI